MADPHTRQHMTRLGVSLSQEDTAEHLPIGRETGLVIGLEA